jgi:hypothetical protein
MADKPLPPTRIMSCCNRSAGQTFQKQFEYDGLGRLTSVCEMSSTLSNVGPCGQTIAQTSYLTTYTYDALGRMLGVPQNAQKNGTPQTRSFAHDWLGRLTSETLHRARPAIFMIRILPAPAADGRVFGV